MLVSFGIPYVVYLWDEVTIRMESLARQHFYLFLRPPVQCLIRTALEKTLTRSPAIFAYNTIMRFAHYAENFTVLGKKLSYMKIHAQPQKQTRP